VRTALAALGAAALLALASGAFAPAWADDPVPPPDATSEVGGCDQDPLICQSGAGMSPTTIDCGLPVNDRDAVAAGEPAPGTDPAAPPSDTATATVDPDAPTASPADGEDVVCIAASAGGLPQGPVSDTTGGVGAPEAAPGQLPRTGPAPLLESVAIGSWLLLLGVLAVIAGRRTARG
jgi:hypothetical protein